MAPRVPQNANEFIEAQLSERAEELSEKFLSDVLTFSGPIMFGVDDIIRLVIENIKQRSGQDALTVLLTTTGGYIEVVHRIVDTLRHHYKQVNFVVPNYAFSAGTILVMSGDCIYMDYYSRLGPIDPQVETAKGKPVPALGYLEQWERLLHKAKKSQLTLEEAQLMIEGFDQAELYKYEQARELSITLLKQWLVKYKFKNWLTTETRKVKVTKKMREQRAEKIAKELNKTDKWHTHGHGISREILERDLGLKIDDFGIRLDLSDIIRSYHSLFQDYMAKMQHRGALHTVGSYTPFAL